MAVSRSWNASVGLQVNIYPQSVVCSLSHKPLGASCPSWASSLSPCYRTNRPWLEVSGIRRPSGCGRIWTAMPFKARQHGESYREPARHKERNTHIMGLLIWVPQHFPLRFMSWGWFSWKAISGANSPALFCSPSDLLLFILTGFHLLPGSCIPQH